MPCKIGGKVEKNIKNKKNKTEIALIMISAALLLIALVFPLIIWDALGGGAMHFMQYSRVSVSGDSDGNSKATFFFGLLYFFGHSSSDFIPTQLFSAQWRVLMGITEISAAAGGLGIITMIFTVLIFVTPLLMIIIYTLKKFTKTKIINKISKYFSISMAAIELLTVIWFSIIIFGMLSKISGYEFRFYDFMAYGGIKLVLEALFSLALCALNVFLFLNILKSKKAEV